MVRKFAINISEDINRLMGTIWNLHLTYYFYVMLDFIGNKIL